MEVSIRKIGNAQGIIFPNELSLEVGVRYRIEQSGPALIMTPINSELFANPDDWVGFRDSISQADREWDQLADS
ncbi:AbrB/MazE/SpoVT family DNA-binding domain-containing protein [Lactiplantibacillus plantarum]|uniref:AbrB/MazE/SpoVT family DNA-binding domain-containing protein n=1 Tax=Lactiplantibacillus plantarum TaxID=1590 RepID=UPI00321883E3